MNKQNAMLIFALVLLGVGCSNYEHPIQLTKITCESGYISPWSESEHFSLSNGGFVVYRRDGAIVVDRVERGDKCVQTFKYKSVETLK